MAITRSQSKTGSDTSATSVSLTLDSAFAADEYLIVSIAITVTVDVRQVTWADGIAGTASDAIPLLPGYPVTVNGIEGGGIQLYKFYLPRLPTTVNAPVIVVSSTASANMSVTAEVFASVRRFDAIDVQASDGETSNTTVSTGTTLATSEDDMLCHAAFAWQSNSAVSVGPTNDFANGVTVAASTFNTVYAAFKVISASATVESSITQGGAEVSMAGGVDTFRQEPAGETPSGLDDDIVPELFILGNGRIRL